MGSHLVELIPIQDEDLFLQRTGYFDYKLHLISSTGSIIIPVAADFTMANIQDNNICDKLTKFTSCNHNQNIIYFCKSWVQ